MVSEVSELGKLPELPKLILRDVQANRFDVLARDAEDEVPSIVPATPGGVDARRVFSIANFASGQTCPGGFCVSR